MGSKNTDKMQAIMVKSSGRQLNETPKIFNIFCFLFLTGGTGFMLSGCASIYDDYDKSLLKNEEFDKQVKIKPSVAEVPWGKPIDKADQKRAAKKPVVKEVVSPIKASAPAVGANAAAAAVAAETTGKHEPDLEDGEGFIGRRPVVDPFKVGEEITYAASYFAVEAGRVTMAIKPFIEVNGRKSYHFQYTAKSSSVFSMFYAVDDSAEAFLDYEDMVPYSYTIKARETKQIRDVKTYFDWKTMKAKMWDKKIKKGKGPEEKNIDWDLLPYSQNVMTVAYYLRTFQLKVGKEIAVRVAHEGKNIIMRAKVVREEVLKTPAGKFNTYVVQPEFTIDGNFKPVGAVFIWLTKDERKTIVRIESKIKIGTVVVAVQKIK